MMFDIKTKKNKNKKQISFQRDQNADESKNYQKLKQILMKKFENRKNISRNNNNDIVTSSNDDVDYIKFVIKKRTKTKNLKIKKKYFIL